MAIKGYFYYFLCCVLCPYFDLVFRWIASASLSQKITTGKDGRALPLSPEALIKKNMKENTKEVADYIAANIIGTTKTVLTSEEAARYMGISMSYLYKLTMARKVPHYKSPTGKMCYFNRSELEQWLQSNRVSTDDEVGQKAQEYCMKGGVK